MAQRLTTQDFIMRAQEVHSNKYEYSKTRYTNTTTPVTITCKIHGEFEQQPKIHLKGCDCPKCALVNHPRHIPMTTNEFVARATATHGDSFDYSATSYIDTNTKVTLQCITCGHIFNMLPSAHIFGQGCPECARRNRGKRLAASEFLERLQQRYGDDLIYDKVTYVNLSTPVTLTCRKHGVEFMKRGDYLLDNKVSCPMCVDANRPGKYHVNRTTLKNVDKPATLYVLALHLDDEQFYKIGITTATMAQRISTIRPSGYTVNILETYTMKLDEAIRKEHDLLVEYSSYGYTPKLKFGGYTECISVRPTISW